MRHFWLQQSITENIYPEQTPVTENISSLFSPNEQSPNIWTKGRKSLTWVSLWLIFSSMGFLIAVLFSSHGHSLGLYHGQTWTHMAMPIPPPMQRLATPRVAPRRRIAWTKVTSTRQPLAPDDQHVNEEDGDNVGLTYGMAKGNRTTIDVHLCRINAQLFHLWFAQYI